MAAKQVLLTDEGLHNLEQELEFLKTERRKEIAEKIKVALSFGDLSENSEYDEAKNDQAMVEARIADIESMLKNVKIIDQDELTTELIHIGSKVQVKDVEFDEVCTYQIVGSSEADPSNGRISDESPVGKGLLGHKVGETVEIDCLAVALTFGLAWKAIPRPAILIIGKSFAPSPTATVWRISTFSTCAIRRNNSALRFPSTISPT